MFGFRTAVRAFAAALSLVLTTTAADAAPTGFCDVSPGEYTSYTGTSAGLETANVLSPGVSQSRCLKDIQSLGGFVVNSVFRDSKGRYADELPTYGKLVNTWPGENANSVCNTTYPAGKRNAPLDLCTAATYTSKPIAETAAHANALDWKFAKPVRYTPLSRIACPSTWPPMGCYGDRCYDPECVNTDGSLKTCGSGQICKKGACVAGTASSLPACKIVPNHGAVGTKVENGSPANYEPWNGLVFDLGGLASKVAVFPINDRSPQPCESIEYTVYLTNDPSSREFIDDPGPVGPNPKKWNRAKLYKIYTHGWIDNPDCCSSPKTCDPTKCAVPKDGDPPVFEGDAMTIVYALPCGIAFRYAAFVAGYDGRSLGDPAAGADRCSYHSFDAEIDAVAGLNDDESAICPDRDGDGFPTCDCSPKPSPCDCVDDPGVNPEAKKYFPGAPQACDGPAYSCAPLLCPTGSSCINSQCLRPCAGGEFKCPGGFTCTSVTATDGGAKSDVCVPAPCGDAGNCPAGQLCKSGTCVDLCAPPTKCPPGHVCQSGVCFDPCALVTCPAGEVCNGGKCTLPCACLKPTAFGYPCGGSTSACRKESNTCVAPGCDTLKCAPGKVCVGTEAGPKCKGTCEDVVCPGKQVCDPVKGCADKCDLLATPCASDRVCRNGVCVDLLCANVDCDPPFECREGVCVEADTGVTFDGGVADGGVTDDATVEADGSVPPPGGWPKSPDKEGAGCRCSTPGGSSASLLVACAGLGLAVAAFARRRRR